MPRFFFNVYDDVVAIDHEGMELPNLEAARLSALQGARELIAEQVKHGYIVQTHWIDVVDEGGNTVLTLSFRECVTIRE